jgi:hypothetical protein
MRRYLADMVVEITFRIKKYSQVFNRVGMGYRGLTKFIPLDQYVSGFLGRI